MLLTVQCCCRCTPRSMGAPWAHSMRMMMQSPAWPSAQPQTALSVPPGTAL